MNFKNLFIFSFWLYAPVLLHGMQLNISTLTNKLIEDWRQSGLEKEIIAEIDYPEKVESIKNELVERYSNFFSRLSQIDLPPVVAKEESGFIGLVAISPCGNYIAAGTDLGIVHVWPLKKLVVLKPPTFCLDIIKEIGKAWNLKISDSQVFEIHSGAIRALEWSPDSRYIVTGADDNLAALIDLRESQVVMLDGHQEAVRSVAFNPDGGSFATGSLDRKVCIWDMKTASPITSFRAYRGHTEGLFIIKYAPETKLLITSSNGEISFGI